MQINTFTRIWQIGLASATAVLALITVWNGLQADVAGGTVRYVDANGGSDDSDCTTPTDPCATLGYAVGQTTIGDAIYAAQGTYSETLIITQSLLLAGGYEADGWTRDLFQYSTIIDAASGPGQPAIRFEGSSDGAVLDGFTIQNTAVNQDGAITIDGVSVRIQNCLIRNNFAEGQDEWGSGGLLLSGNTGTVISNTIIAGNHANGGAGAIRVGDGAFTLVNSLLWGNTGRMAIHANDAGMTLTNVTVADHGMVGGVLLNNSQAAIWNTILWEEMAPDIELLPGSVVTISYSNVEDGVMTGTDNISANPLFVDAANGDYHLQVGSPAINAGTAVDAPAADLEGVLRENAPDMGAYEWVGSQIFLPILRK